MWSGRTGNVTLSNLKRWLGSGLPVAFAVHCQGTTVTNEDLLFNEEKKCIDGETGIRRTHLTNVVKEAGWCHFQSRSVKSGSKGEGLGP